MLRYLLLITLFLAFLPVAQGRDFNILEDNKDTAYIIECTLENLMERVESMHEKGEISLEDWDEFRYLHGETESFLHLYIMANLYYEEAPVEPYGRLVELFARDMIYRLVLLDNFCLEIGIEAIPEEMV